MMVYGDMKITVIKPRHPKRGVNLVGGGLVPLHSLKAAYPRPEAPAPARGFTPEFDPEPEIAS
jgi:hypothetical protein